MVARKNVQGLQATTLHALDGEGKDRCDYKEVDPKITFD